MEKSASSKVTVKAEPKLQHDHGAGSSSAVTATVDPKALECVGCFRPLKPPVFQCAAGHVVCSTCRGTLQDSDSYSRCHAVERILRFVSAPCPNAAHGCGVQVLFNEREEHEKQCPHAVPGGGSGDTLPEISRAPAAFTVSIGEASVAVNKIAKEQAAVMMLGPCGGSGGDAVKMDMRGVNRIVRVVVRHGNAVDAMAVLFKREGLDEWTDQWGGTGGESSEFWPQPDEYLTSVEGHYGQFKGKVVIRSLKFVSNTRTYGPYGMEDGVPFALPAAAGGKILGFHARSGVFLDAIGTYVKMDD